ncbi:hypothetical protein NDU88_002349 [Pleurodeles waltl]|uniref:Uncharacterized protein n=1 Tax=Pleurodeles waltl TaxID=8319 RepID=A0AAV7P6I9_PLEWA|nr:hypothetical protein NDU88_002349 [Pleurodeles waltl]
MRQGADALFFSAAQRWLGGSGAAGSRQRTTLFFSVAQRRLSSSGASLLFHFTLLLVSGFNHSLSAAIVSLQRLHAYSQCLGDAYSQCFGNALFLRTQYAQECVRATLSSVSIHFLVALKSHHRLSWRHEHADGRPRSFPLSWRHIYASRLVKTCLCLALGARAQFQFLHSIKPKIVITIILADHSPAILEMRSSSSVPNGVPDRERPVSRNQGKRRHPVEASDT